MASKIRRLTPGESVFNFINTVIMLFLLLITLYPFWYCIIVSFNDANNLVKGPLYLVPRLLSFDNYKFVFSNSLMGTAFINSILRTVIGTFLHCLFTGMAAFGLSKRHLMGRRLYMAIFVITMYFGGGMIPNYLLIKSLGLINNFLVYIIPGLWSFFNAILFIAFYESIPDSLEESAKVDGASVLLVFFKIIIPVSMPIFATVALFTGVGQWNSWYDTMVYAQSKKLVTLQSILINLIREADSLVQLQKLMGITGGSSMLKISPVSVRVSTLVVTTFPIVVVYPFLQKYFIKGILLGAVKS
jgi:putative aldouronate transport system permease protein